MASLNRSAKSMARLLLLGVRLRFADILQPVQVECRCPHIRNASLRNTGATASYEAPDNVVVDTSIARRVSAEWAGGISNSRYDKGQ